MMSQERVFKIINVIFQLSYQKLYCLNFIKIEWLSQVLFMSEFQYQNNTKWWCKRDYKYGSFSDMKSRQKDYKSGQGLQIGAEQQ